MFRALLYLLFIYELTNAKIIVRPTTITTPVKAPSTPVAATPSVTQFVAPAAPVINPANILAIAVRKEFYFDNNSTTINPTGDKARPFNSLQDLITQLKRGFPSPTVVNVYLKPTSKPYFFKNESNIINSTNTNIVGLVILPYAPKNLSNERDCELFPAINGADFNLTLASMISINITGVRFNQMNGSLSIKEAQQVSMTDLCIDDGASVSNQFFVIKDTDNFALQRSVVTIANGTEIINYSNGKPEITSKKVTIENITLNFLNNTNKILIETQNEAYFRFTLANTSSSANQNFTLNNISFQNKGSIQVFPQVFEISRWKDVTIKGINLTEQSFYISRNGVFELRKIKSLALKNCVFSENAIYSQVFSRSKEKISFFSVKDVSYLQLTETLISENYINGSSSLENNFRFLQIDGISSFEMKNIRVFGNEFNVLTYMVRIKTQTGDDSVGLTIHDTIIDSNNATDNVFYLMKFSEAKIGSFKARNMTISRNNFSSRIFDIYTVGDADLPGQHLSDAVVRHIPFSFIDISILNNPNLLNFGLLLLFVGNAPALPPDYVPDYEYYLVGMNNLTIQNNLFDKGQDRDWSDQLSVMQVSGASVYIQNSTLADNKFISFDFVSIYRELSSIFFVNSTVNNTNFTESHFMITRYEGLMITRGPFFNISSSNREVQAIYRYSFVLDSNFTNMEISGGGSLFTFRNAFLLLRGNNLDSITFNKSHLLNAGKFRPPGNDLANITFIRNHKIERESLEKLNPALLQIYRSVVADLKILYPETVYFYTLIANNMTNLKLYSKSLFNFEDYQSKQSFICVIMNTFSAFDIPAVATDVIHLSGSLQAFNFYNNTIEALNGDGSVIRLSALEENKHFVFSNNTIRDIEGPSILVASGTEIRNMGISYNVIQESSFSNTLFMIDMVLHYGNITFVENIFQDNVLLVDNNDLNSMNSFLEVSSEASNENAFFTFEKCLFLNNTHINLRTFNQFSQLNAMINLLLANSSLVINDCTFQDTRMNSQGSDMFYVAAENVQVTNCKFTNTAIINGQSIFNPLQTEYINLAIYGRYLGVNLLSWNIVFESNDFSRTVIPFGKGLLFLSPWPFLKEIVNLKMISNQFDEAICGQNFVQNSANVLFVENSKLILSATNNILVDTFSMSPVFYFSNTTFISSIILNSTLHVSEKGDDLNYMYQVVSSRGDLGIQNDTIEYHKQDNDPDLLFKCQESPDVKVTIANLSWGSGSQKNTIRLADVDSGHILITDTVMEDFVYPVQENEEGGLIVNVGSKKSKGLNLNLTLSNVTFRNMNFIIPSKLEKTTFGMIGFVGSETAIESVRPWLFRLKSCSFSSIKNAVAVYVNMPIVFDVIITQTIFDSISSRFGPAFDFFAHTANKSNIVITHSNFTNNKALKAGGAIYIAFSGSRLKNNTFINNTAGDLGGCMVLQNQQKADLILKENTFINNRALAGNNIASLPTQFSTKFIFQNGTSLQVVGSQLQNSHNQSVSIRNITKVAVNLTLIDDEGYATLDTSNTAKRFAILTFADQPSITTFNCTKTGCYINSLNITLTGEFNQTKAVDVQFTSDVSKYNFQKRFKATISPCLEGEHFNPYTKTCDFCSEGTYSLSANDPCQKCPENAYCPGGSIILPKAGYWHSTATNNLSPVVLECRKDGVSRCEAVLDPFGDFIARQCKPGYEGVKCEACELDRGYVEAGLLQCKKCSNVVASFVFTILTTFGFTLGKLYCIVRLYRANKGLCSSSVESDAAKKENLESTYYVRLLLLYTQILSMIFLFHNEVREVIGSYAQLGNPTEFILVKLECSMVFLGIPSSYFIYASVVFLFLSPLVQCLLVIVIALVALRSRFEPSEVKYFVRLSFIYVILAEQPGIVGFMTSFISCSQDDSYSPPYVGLHPNLKCDSRQYFIMKNFIVAPCLIIWAALIPLYSVLTLFFKRNKLNSLSVRLPWGSLYSIYKAKYYWWGGISMLLGINLSFITYRFQGDLKTCLALAFILLWVYQIAVRRFKPYKSDSMNKMEATTIGLLILNLMLGYFTLNSPIVQLRYIAYVALIVINASMLTYILYKIASSKVVDIVGKVVRKLTFKKDATKRRKSDGPNKLPLLEADDLGKSGIRSESTDCLLSSHISHSVGNPTSPDLIL